MKTLKQIFIECGTDEEFVSTDEIIECVREWLQQKHVKSDTRENYYKNKLINKLVEELNEGS